MTGTARPCIADHQDHRYYAPTRHTYHLASSLRACGLPLIPPYRTVQKELKMARGTSPQAPKTPAPRAAGLGIARSIQPAGPVAVARSPATIRAIAGGSRALV